MTINTTGTISGTVEVTGGALTVEQGTFNVVGTQCFDVFVCSSGSLTINAGTITGGKKSLSTAVWAKDNGIVVINGGTFTIDAEEGDYNDLIYAKDNAKITVNGGHFSGVYSEELGSNFLLNIKNGSAAQITVYGGTFVGFNPGNSGTEPGANNNFCAEGYGPTDLGNGTYGVHEHVAGEVVVENNKAPTCTKEGSYDNVVYCTECDAELSRETVKVNMLEHTPNKGVIEHNEGTTTHTVTVSCTVCKGNLSTETKNCTDADNSFACDACGGFVMNDFSSFVIIAEELSGNKTVEGSVVTLKYTGNVSFAPAQGVGAWNHWFGFKITAPTGVDVTKVIILRPDDVTRVMGNILDGDYYAYLYWGMTSEQDRIAEYKIDWNGDGEYDLTVVLDATGATLLECQHAWNQGEETTKATCVQEGVMTYTCANCGATRTETIEKKPHTDVIDEGYAATCTTPGLTEGTHCSVCGEIRVAQNEIPVLEHVYDAGIVLPIGTDRQQIKPIGDVIQRFRIHHRFLPALIFGVLTYRVSDGAVYTLPAYSWLSRYSPLGS